MRKVLFLVLCLSLCQVALPGLQVFAQDKIAAVVNNDIITAKDLDDYLNFMRVQFSKEYKGKALENKIQAMKLDLLERLIEDRMILQEAYRTIETARTNKDQYTLFRLNVDDNKVKGKVNEMRKRYSSEVDFENDLVKQGLTLADIEKKIREQLLSYSIVDLIIREQVRIRPEEVTAFYNKNPAEFSSGEERQVRIISLENNDLAKSLSYNLRTGQKLEDLATRYPFTVDTMVVNNKKGELKKEIEEVVFKLNIGEASNPVTIDQKNFVFILDNVVPAKQLTLPEVQDRIYSFLYESKMRESLDKWVAELRKKSYIKVMQ